MSALARGAARTCALAAGRAPRTLPAAVAPVLVGTALAASRGRVPAAAVRGRAGRQRLHPDRDEPLQRLLGRPPRRRHRGPARPGARDRRRADAAAAGAGRHLRRVRDRGRRGRLPGRGGRLGAAGGRRRLDPRRACSTPAARAPTATRASASCSCSCSSASSPWSAPTSCRPRSCAGRRSRSRCRSGCSPRRSSW